MTVIIRLSDEQATALEAKATAEGLTIEQWIQKLAESGPKPARELGRARTS
jgi:predicted DNA binding CopG/RHH family protein